MDATDTNWGGDTDHVVHETKHPDAPVTAGLLKTNPHTGALATSSSVSGDAIVSELPLLRLEPSSLQGTIRESEPGNKSHHDGDCALQNEEPEARLVT